VLEGRDVISGPSKKTEPKISEPPKKADLPEVTSSDCVTYRGYTAAGPGAEVRMRQL
jgi:hypothetical protein